jgi:Gas vesicle synthesis protein GvpL/GvpF.
VGLYLYAILPECSASFAGQVKATGMADAPVQLYPLSKYLIAYSPTTEERYLASRANLLTHEKVLETFMQAIPARLAVPLPLRFGLVVADWQTVDQQLIVPYADTLDQLLEKLVGKREVGIKIFWQTTAELNFILEKDADLRRKREALAGKILSMDEAIAIGRELENALEQRQQLIINTFLDQLQPLCHEYVEGELLTDNMLFNAAFLIDWEKEPEFARRVEALDELFEKRYRIRYNDFTAPYNFVRLEM